MKKLLRIKKKGMTLIEVLVTIAVFSIILIPLSMLVASSVKYDKKGENLQQVSTSAQRVIENIKSSHSISGDAIPLNITNSTQYLRKLDTVTDSSKYDMGYSIQNADIDMGDDITADITLQRKKDLAYDSGQASTMNNDASVTITADGNFTLEDAGSLNNIYPLTGDLEIVAEDNTILLKNKSGGDIVTVNKKAGSPGIIKLINRKTSDINVYTKNNSQLDTKILNVLVSKDSGYGAIKLLPEGGSIKKYLNVPGSDPSNSNLGVYDLNIKIYDNDGSKKKIYEVTSSVDIEK